MTSFTLETLKSKKDQIEKSIRRKKYFVMKTHGLAMKPGHGDIITLVGRRWQVIDWYYSDLLFTTAIRLKKLKD